MNPRNDVLDSPVSGHHTQTKRHLQKRKYITHERHDVVFVGEPNLGHRRNPTARMSRYLSIC